MSAHPTAGALSIPLDEAGLSLFESVYADPAFKLLRDDASRRFQWITDQQSQRFQKQVGIAAGSTALFAAISWWGAPLLAATFPSLTTEVVTVGGVTISRLDLLVPAIASVITAPVNRYASGFLLYDLRGRDLSKFVLERAPATALTYYVTSLAGGFVFALLQKAPAEGIVGALNRPPLPNASITPILPSTFVVGRSYVVVQQGNTLRAVSSDAIANTLLQQEALKIVLPATLLNSAAATSSVSGLRELVAQLAGMNVGNITVHLSDAPLESVPTRSVESDVELWRQQHRRANRPTPRGYAGPADVDAFEQHRREQNRLLLSKRSNARHSGTNQIMNLGEGSAAAENPKSGKSDGKSPREKLIDKLALDLVERASRGELADPSAVNDIFVEYSKLYRPTHEEQESQQFLTALAREARVKIWAKMNPAPNELVPISDPKGNMIIPVPATGRFAGKKLSSIAIQTHQDMVLDVSTAVAGEDLRPYFKNGVDLEVTDGVVHSKNHLTSIGADNGIGDAMPIRLLLNPQIEHPRLELVFTVAEEVGLTGVKAFALPLHSKVLLNLDGEEEDALVSGCPGSVRGKVEGELPGVPLPANSALVHVEVSGLVGGHSASDIDRPRLHAVKDLGEFLNLLIRLYPELQLVDVVAGNEDRLNKIPNSFSATIAVSARHDPNRVVEMIRMILQETVRRHADEILEDTKIIVEHIDYTTRRRGLSIDTTRRLAHALIRVPNGSESGVFETERTTSSLGYLSLNTNEKKRMVLNIKYMIRWFKESSFTVRLEEIRNNLRDIWKGQNQPPTESDEASYPPWQTEGQSWVTLLGLERAGFKRDIVEIGGLEPTIFVQKFPGLIAVAFGVPIKDAHSHRESYEAEKATAEAQRLDLFLGEIGDSYDFQKISDSPAP